MSAADEYVFVLKESECTEHEIQQNCTKQFAQPSRFETSHREMKYIERELNDEKKIISFVFFR